MSQLEVDKVIPQSGTTLTIGDSGDTITIASGATLSGDLNASNLTSGTVPDARITGTYTGLTGLDLTDNSKIRLGTGNDLEIFHSSTSGNSFIKDVGTGALILGSDGTKILLQKTDGENMGVFNTDGSVDLYHNNVKKFETTSTGVEVTGNIKTSTTGSVTSGTLQGIGGTPIDIDRFELGVGFLNLDRDFASEVNQIQFGKSGTLAAAFATGQDYLVIKTNGNNERARIDASGNLLVGKTSDGSALSSVGINLRPTANSTFTADGNQALQIGRLTSDGLMQGFYKDGTIVGSISSHSSGGIRVESSHSLELKSSATNGLRLDDAGIFRPQTDNVTDMGKSSNRFKDLYLSGGLYVGGTGTANKLDDYEEGTWTPTLTNETTAVYSNQTGWYRKIGETVFIYFSVSLSSKGDISGSYTRIGSLPFTGSPTTRYGSGQIHNYRISSSKHIQGIEFGGSIGTSCWIMTGGGSAAGYLNTSFVADNTFFEGFGMYRTA